MSTQAQTLFVLFAGPGVLAAMVGFVLWVTHESEADQRKRAEEDRAIWLEHQAATKPPTE